jgi:hypothetical protein
MTREADCTMLAAAVCARCCWTCVSQSCVFQVHLELVHCVMEARTAQKFGKLLHCGRSQDLICPGGYGGSSVWRGTLLERRRCMLMQQSTCYIRLRYAFVHAHIYVSAIVRRSGCGFFLCRFTWRLVRCSCSTAGVLLTLVWRCPGADL